MGGDHGHGCPRRGPYLQSRIGHRPAASRCTAQLASGPASITARAQVMMATPARYMMTLGMIVGAQLTVGRAHTIIAKSAALRGFPFLVIGHTAGPWARQKRPLPQFGYGARRT